jgi:V/A-type H+/Na+-transporting ATPase subunit E
LALSDLLTGLKEEAAAEEARRDAEARAEVARIAAEADAEAQQLQEQALRVVENELRTEAEARRARARLAAAATVREAREEAFREFLRDVWQRLESARGSSGYPAVLRALLQESLTALPGAAVARVDPRDARLAGDLLGELGLELKLEPTLQTAGGVELAHEEDLVVRNTLEERFANAEPELRLVFGAAQSAEAP